MTDKPKVLGMLQLNHDNAVLLPMEDAIALFKQLATATFVHISYTDKIDKAWSPGDHSYPQLKVVRSTIIEEIKAEQAITP
jgi:hypothetical protein